MFKLSKISNKKSPLVRLRIKGLHRTDRCQRHLELGSDGKSLRDQHKAECGEEELGGHSGKESNRTQGQGYTCDSDGTITKARGEGLAPPLRFLQSEGRFHLPLHPG